MNAGEFPAWLVTLFQSFWGLFAWMASPLPQAAYWVLAVTTAAGVAGYLSNKKRKPAENLLLVALLLVFLQTFYHGFMHTRQPQGRFLFPALGPIAFVLASGWKRFWVKLPARHKTTAWVIVIAAIAGLQVLSLRAL